MADTAAASAQGSAISENVSDKMRLYNEKLARRAAEEDAQRLYNRVRHLEKEDDALKKRIEETKKRVEDIRKQKHRNEAKLEEKELRRLQEEALAAQKNSEFKKLKDENEKKKKSAADKLALSKLSISAETKREREENDRLMAEQKLLLRKKALEGKEKVKEEAKSMKERHAEMNAKRSNDVHAEYQSKLDEERKRKSQYEKELKKLSEKELTLIQSLQEKQQLQRLAYEELESALGVKGKAGKQQQQQAAVADNEPDEEEIARQFSRFDPDKVAKCHSDDLGALIESLGITLNEQQLAQAKSQLVGDEGDGLISYGDFLLWWRG